MHLISTIDTLLCPFFFNIYVYIYTFNQSISYSSFVLFNQLGTLGSLTGMKMNYFDHIAKFRSIWININWRRTALKTTLRSTQEQRVHRRKKKIKNANRITTEAKYPLLIIPGDYLDFLQRRQSHEWEVALLSSVTFITWLAALCTSLVHDAPFHSRPTPCRLRCSHACSAAGEREKKKGMEEDRREEGTRSKALKEH